MKWRNLAKNKCPACSKNLLFNEKQERIWCSCGFKISNKRMGEIVADLNTQSIKQSKEALRIQEENKNQEALSSL